MILLIDEGWLSAAAHAYVPQDPDITDYGALGAAVARHRHETMGTLVYPEAHHRAAALLHSLVRVPALEHSNELYAVAVATAYLAASGYTVKAAPPDALALAQQTAAGEIDVRQIAAVLRTWITE
jgi:death-on-curing protein